MTFQPVLPWAVLVAVSTVVIAIRLLSLHQLRAERRRPRIMLWRWCAATVALLLIVVSATRPSIGTVEREDATTATQAGNVNVFYVVDRSVAGAVTDYSDGTQRMAAVRTDIAALTARYPQARFALITFASRPSLDWPLSADAWSLDAEISTLTPDDTTNAETQSQIDAAAAANVLRYQLIAAGQQYPGSQNLVFYFGFGAPGSRAPQGEFDLPARLVDGGAVFGYGTPSDAPEALNESQLRRVAAQLGLPYVHRIGTEPITRFAPAPDGSDQSARIQASSVMGRSELYWVFALLAAGLLLLEVYLTVRDLRRTVAAHRDVVQ
jgi:hypothetical protein